MLSARILSPHILKMLFHKDMVLGWGLCAWLGLYLHKLRFARTAGVSFRVDGFAVPSEFLAANCTLPDVLIVDGVAMLSCYIDAPCTEYSRALSCPTVSLGSIPIRVCLESLDMLTSF